VVEKTQGEGKAAKMGERGWHSGVASANYIDLRDSPLFYKMYTLQTEIARREGRTQNCPQRLSHPRKEREDGAPSV
jgi:hypothetical protein